MKRNIGKTGLVFGAIIISVLLISSVTVMGFTSLDISRFAESTEEIESNEFNYFLSSYGLNMASSTMAEFKDLLYATLNEENLENDDYTTQLRLDVEESFDALEQIGVTSDMTLTQAKILIEDNLGYLVPLGFNLLCSIDLSGFGYTFPSYSTCGAARGRWGTEFGTDYGSTIDGLLGKQQSPDTSPLLNTRGVFIGLEGFISGIEEVSLGPGLWTYQIEIDGFALFVRSNMPYVGGSSSIYQIETNNNLLLKQIFNDLSSMSLISNIFQQIQQKIL